MLWYAFFLNCIALTRDEAWVQKKMCLCLKYGATVQHPRALLISECLHVMSDVLLLSPIASCKNEIPYHHYPLGWNTILLLIKTDINFSPIRLHWFILNTTFFLMFSNPHKSISRRLLNNAVLWLILQSRQDSATCELAFLHVSPIFKVIAWAICCTLDNWLLDEG